MKISVLLSGALLMSAHSLFAQDTLIKLDGYRFEVIVKAVNPYDIVYGKQAWDSLKTQAISRSVIAGIHYADGRADTFFVTNKRKELIARSPLMSPDSMYAYGRKDAKIYYSRYHRAGNGTLLATFPGSPLAGLITAGITSAVAPKDKNLQFPNGALAQNKSYYDGYKSKAWSMKRRQVWTSWGVGVLATAVLVAAATAL